MQRSNCLNHKEYVTKSITDTKSGKKIYSTDVQFSILIKHNASELHVATRTQITNTEEILSFNKIFTVCI